MVPAVLWVLAEKLRLQREDVVQHAVDTASLHPVVGDDPGSLEMAAQQFAERAVDAGLSVHLRLFEQLEASVQRQLS